MKNSRKKKVTIEEKNLSIDIYTSASPLQEATEDVIHQTKKREMGSENSIQYMRKA